MKGLIKVFLCMLISVQGYTAQANQSLRLDGDTLALPFNEEFTTGLLQTNGWTVEGDNWHVAGQAGNPAPSAEFNNTSLMPDYNISLISPWMDGTAITDCRISLDFDFRLYETDGNFSANERLIAEVYSDSAWFEVFSYASLGSTNWITKKIDITEFSRSKVFRIRFRAYSPLTIEIVSWYVDNINVHKYCPPPYDFVLTVPNPVFDPCKVFLEWENPCNLYNSDNWLNWDYEFNYDGISTNDGIVFNAAVKFTSQQLEPFIGGTIETIRFYPSNSAGPIIIKIWKGPDVSQPIYTKPIFNSYIPGEWNIIGLDTTIFINPDEDLYFGYEVDSDPGEPVAGIDHGPAITGYGDLVSTDGLTWEPLSSFDLNYNWNLGAYIGGISIGDTCQILRYNIYSDNDNVVLDSTSENSYYYYLTGEAFDMYCFYVTAIFNDGESEKSNIDCEVSGDCPVSVTDIESIPIEMFPNPTSATLFVKLPDNILNMAISDLTGRIILRYGFGQSQHEFSIDVSNYIPGMYVVRFMTNSGSIEKKLVIQ